MKHIIQQNIFTIIILLGIALLISSCGKTNKKQISTSLDETEIIDSIDVVETSHIEDTIEAVDSTLTEVIPIEENEVISPDMNNKTKPVKVTTIDKSNDIPTEDEVKDINEVIVEEEIDEKANDPVETEVEPEETNTPVEVVEEELPSDTKPEVVVEESPVITEDPPIEVEEKETEQANDDWEVPAKYKNMMNPVEADSESLKIGKSLYKKHCTSCHGKTGLGDGKKAEELETFSGDFTLPLYQDQTDGALFYKTIEGRDEMPGYKKKIPDDEDIWHIINYTRTFK